MKLVINKITLNYKGYSQTDKYNVYSGTFDSTEIVGVGVLQRTQISGQKYSIAALQCGNGFVRLPLYCDGQNVVNLWFETNQTTKIENFNDFINSLRNEYCKLENKTMGIK